MSSRKGRHHKSLPNFGIYPKLWCKGSWSRIRNLISFLDMIMIQPVPLPYPTRNHRTARATLLRPGSISLSSFSQVFATKVPEAWFQSRKPWYSWSWWHTDPVYSKHLCVCVRVWEPGKHDISANLQIIMGVRYINSFTKGWKCGEKTRDWDWDGDLIVLVP